MLGQHAELPEHPGIVGEEITTGERGVVELEADGAVRETAVPPMVSKTISPL